MDASVDGRVQTTAAAPIKGNNRERALTLALRVKALLLTQVIHDLQAMVETTLLPGLQLRNQFQRGE